MFALLINAAKVSHPLLLKVLQCCHGIVGRKAKASYGCRAKAVRWAKKAGQNLGTPRQIKFFGLSGSPRWHSGNRLCSLPLNSNALAH
jgi:hypothetical protein